MQVFQSNKQNKGPVSLRCPHCNHEAIFRQIGEDLFLGQNIYCGQRACPEESCKGHIFVVFDGNNLVKSYPPIRIDFDKENIPTQVINTFEEALDCHANEAFIASAIMVRRTLEEICSDKSAQGSTLKARLKDLRSKIVIPQELFDAMDDLRILGNDAAHVEARDFSKISSEELNIAIELTKEILKALYQYSGLLGRLKNLKSDTGA